MLPKTTDEVPGGSSFRKRILYIWPTLTVNKAVVNKIETYAGIFFVSPGIGQDRDPLRRNLLVARFKIKL